MVHKASNKTQNSLPRSLNFASRKGAAAQPSAGSGLQGAHFGFFPSLNQEVKTACEVRKTVSLFVLVLQPRPVASG